MYCTLYASAILRIKSALLLPVNYTAVLQTYSRIYLDMLNVYKVMSENITAAITHNGEQVGIEKLVDPSGSSYLDLWHV